MAGGACPGVLGREDLDGGAGVQTDLEGLSDGQRLVVVNQGPSTAVGQVQRATAARALQRTTRRLRQLHPHAQTDSLVAAAGLGADPRLRQSDGEPATDDLLHHGGSLMLLPTDLPAGGNQVTDRDLHRQLHLDQRGVVAADEAVRGLAVKAKRHGVAEIWQPTIIEAHGNLPLPS